MYGVPKICKTAKDLERIHEMAKQGKLPREQVKNYWRGLLNNRQRYVFDRILSDTEDPDGNPPDYIVLENELDDGTTERRQHKLEENSDALIFRLGYTVSQVENKISELEVD